MESKKSQRNIIEMWTEDDDDIMDMNRRMSNTSLSRFRSCPHLADEFTIEQQPFESTADDMSRLTARLIINRTSPSNKRKPILERSPCPSSSTPTPPSTPRSRRSILSQKESYSTPTSTPKLLKRRFIERKSWSRDSSTDGTTGSRQSELHDGKFYTPSQLSEENLLKYSSLQQGSSQGNKIYDENDEGDEIGDNVNINKQPKLKCVTNDMNQRDYEDDTQEKCERWLKTLSISKTSKLKSRSHIHLPPIQ